MKAQAIEGEHIPRATPPVPRLRLATVRDCRRELAKLYGEARRGSIPANEACRLGWLLQVLIGAIRDDELERRIAALEARK